MGAANAFAFLGEMGITAKVDGDKIHIDKASILACCGMPEPDSLKMTIETLREQNPSDSYKWGEVTGSSCILECGTP